MTFFTTSRTALGLFLLAGLALLQAGCGRSAGPSASSAAQMSCAQLAEENDQVRELRAREYISFNSPTAIRNERIAVQQQIEMNCQRLRGENPSGGVERVRPIY